MSAPETDRTALLNIAAAMPACRTFLSPYQGDDRKRVPRWVLKRAALQQDQLCAWATKLAGIARRMPTNPSEPKLQGA